MMDFGFLWIPATIAAAAAQTARNATQRNLIAQIGTLGATQVRFLYGLPFAILFLVTLTLVTGERPAAMNAAFGGFALLAAAAQILATGLMLAAMRGESFASVTAIIKTEPVLVAIVGVALLGDAITLPIAAAIVIATCGVLLVSVKAGVALRQASFGAAIMGIAAGAMFAVAAVGFRGAILSLGDGSFLMRATTTLVVGLVLQTLMMGAWLIAFDRPAFLGSVRAWRPSIVAGFLGALASQFWFIGFALTSAANVRTLALVEVLFAALISQRVFAQTMAMREVAGLVLVVAGVALLLFAHP